MSTKKFRVRLAAIAIGLGLVVAVSAPASATTNSGHVTCGYVYAAKALGYGTTPMTIYVGGFGYTWTTGGLAVREIDTFLKSATWSVSAPTLNWGYGTCG